MSAAPNPAPAARRGGAPVGYLAELPAVEAGAVLYLHLWCSGPAAQAEVWNDLARTLGTAEGRAALAAFEELCELARAHARRPLMRHDIGCACLGADEAAFANLVAAAAEGEREDAMIFAALLMRAGMAGAAATLAERVGLALKRMALIAPAPTPAPARLH